MALTDDAIAKIKQLIVSGAWSAGDRLPPEHELGEQLGISRNSLREAVKALAFLGVLQVRHGGGTYVTSLEPELLLTSLAFVTELQDRRSTHEMFEIRCILEKHAAAEAARIATPDQIAALRAELKSPAEITSGDDFIAHGARFHYLLCEISGNRYLTAMVHSLNARPLHDRAQRDDLAPDVTARAVTEHAAICEAIAARDADLAQRLVEEHIRATESWVNVAD